MPKIFNDLILRLRNLAPYQRNRIIFGAIVGLILLFIILGIFGVLGRKEVDQGPPQKEGTLVFWSIFDEEDVFKDIINKYRAKNPQVKIVYRQKDYSSYREFVAELLSAKEGPDIYAIHHTWLPLEKERLVSMNEVVIDETTGKGIDAPSIISKYPDIFRFDFVVEEVDDSGNSQPVIYALPLAIDTLALYYNEDYFNSNGIVFAPGTWEEFVEAVKKLRRIDANNNITLAGVAAGSAFNDKVNRVTDILSLLMIQSGAEMNDKFGNVTFDRGVEAQNGLTYFPAKEAMTFYTSFSNPNSLNYTWPTNDRYSIDAFAQGYAAMMFNYSYHRDTIREKNPSLNFAIAPMPQPQESTKRINYASYWGYAVPKISDEPKLAWDFINFISQEENAKIYLDESNKPTALKSLISYQQKDPELAVFANQILSAKSWIQPDFFEVQRILERTINDVLTGNKDIESALDNGADEINFLPRSFEDL
ncbi:MAG: hypothetical protein A3F94_01670 [Candidatus Spechtbacteria bacterium RIFCSPLOWO2_12_FULL_38_22]|uniref:ABC transporter substrate-binding protein n=1 Tax=Candidatus Spechtbacteria bacterium RIFCSPLOWO2_12_FULL_38_22 TaxID=1802165 RepID=A0A1G2HJ53_9BACT|nr:MAG: hypothetical protein A2728_01175 [Candidatus Spechtbacteria bacterium RIFCSPHIGHO2_01_FULL_38_11]OGZ59080.1 MAG: hypothetical protein A3E58_02300 [Candidatus Spechtbacteria bacterium RIFCSPHIGHO2_12_FULL_38_30]OGZ60721.1 MAG: hypothetical protein A3A00_01705 [Candidatus Spechtbacteria bacterium RIFCSPLOWO2_01_FULL_38_20]OGZ62473.1 MAG: hypothetical protein A3F94_01670 [Candidatus Spechtbacteria bacterium RIFCSPLOWO2_12_FULL_38_22]